MLLLILTVVTVAHISAANPVDLTLQPFQLGEFLNSTFKTKTWNGTWISDNYFIFKTEKGDINIVNAADLKQDLLLAAEDFTKYNKSTISLSPDQRCALIRYNPKAIFRHSQTAQYAVYNIRTKEYHDIASKKHIQYVQWAPVNSGLAYVEDNNIYYLESPENIPIQITNDGVPGIVYNGVPDWVYEEEVLGAGYALWFSPDGNRLAFLSSDDTNVKEFQYYIYGDAANVQNLYPEIIKLRYPKVGTQNPLPVVKHVDFQDPEKKVKTLHDIIPKTVVTADYVVTGVMWATNTDVVAVSENRVQNIAAITRCQVVSDFCDVEVKFEERQGWLGVKPPKYNKNGTKSILHVSQEERGSAYKHLVLFDVVTQKSTRLTFGKRVVLSVLKWNEDKDLVYYSSTIEGSPSHQHTYVVNVKTLEDKCLTCDFETPEGLCKVAVTHLSEDGSYYTRVCNGPGPTFIEIEHLVSRKTNVWEDNSALREQLTTKMRPKIKDIDVPLESGFKARARLWLPSDFDEDSDLKYPMIVDVYGGPNSNRISDSFTTGIVNYFSTNRKYIYAQIDARGSGRNGDNLMFQVYRRLGTVEIEDQIAVAKYLRTHYPFINGEKIGIWGWSYGGFATIWALIKDSENVFKFGLAVAPVTNFIFYDTIYTERYMGLPTEEDNLSGYNNTDATLHVENLRNKSFFLIHGNADDNVHYQQAMHLARALEKADIEFYQQSYPDENHALGGVSPHLYHTIDKFFAQELQKTD